jgi:hypothetical protein
MKGKSNDLVKVNRDETLMPQTEKQFASSQFSDTNTENKR